MDWYVNGIIGEKPVFEHLSEDARTMITLQESLTPLLGDNI